MKIRLHLITVTLIMLAACTTSSSNDFVVAANVQQENLPVLISALPSEDDHIIYVKLDAGEVWAVNPENGETVQVIRGNGLMPKDWSPSGIRWLFVDNYSIYVSNADGSDVRRVFQANHKSYIAAWWLTDEVILFDLYVIDDDGKIWSPPEQHFVNLRTGETQRLDIQREMEVGGTYLTQGIMPESENWMQVDAYSGNVEIADLKGTHTRILGNYKLSYRIGTLAIQFIPNTDKFIFLASKESETSNSLWEMSLAKTEPEPILEGSSDTQVYEYHVSPDGKYIAYTFLNGQEDKVAILDSQNHNVVYEWDYPYNLSSPSFLWSPDSRHIALLYADPDQKLIFGIQIMDISTGALKIVVDEDVMLAAWHETKP